MADLSIAKKHEQIVEEIVQDFKKNNIYAIDRGGYHDIYNNITNYLKKNIGYKFDKDILPVTMKADLRIFLPKLKFVDLDVKTDNNDGTTYDTGNFAIEIWHLLIALKNPFETKKYFCFYTQNKKILIEPKECVRFTITIFCPEDRWSQSDNKLQKDILRLETDFNIQYFKTISWNVKKGSGDYFFLIPKEFVTKEGLCYEDLLRDELPNKIVVKKSLADNPFFPPGEYKRLFGNEFTKEFFTHLQVLNETTTCFMFRKYLKKNFEDLEENEKYHLTVCGEIKGNE